MAKISKISPDGGITVFDLKDKDAQTKNLTNPIEIGGKQKTTVESCLSALAESGGANTNMLNYSNGVEIASGGTYTASKTGEALIRFSSTLSSANLNITINGKTVDHSAVIAKSHSGGSDNTYFGVLNNKFVLDVGDTIVLPSGVTALFVPYK